MQLIFQKPSSSSTSQSKSDNAVDNETDNTKSQEGKDKSSSGLFSSISSMLGLRKSNQVQLPDDKNPTVSY